MGALSDGGGIGEGGKLPFRRDRGCFTVLAATAEKDLDEKINGDERHDATERALILVPKIGISEFLHKDKVLNVKVRLRKGIIFKIDR